jgi:hypothetical protein
LTPIEPEEIPSLDLFFIKKIKAIVRRETQQNGGIITKRKKMIYDA